MQIGQKYPRPACLSVTRPSRVGSGIPFCVVDQDPTHMWSIKFGRVLRVNWRADVTASTWLE